MKDMSKLLELRKKAYNNFDFWDTMRRVLGITMKHSEAIPIKESTMVNVKECMISLWNPAKYKNLSRLPTEQLFKNKPYLTGFETLEGRIYLPSDGNHRIAVAESRGVELVPAFVGSVFGLAEGTLVLNGAEVLYMIEPGVFSVEAVLQPYEMRYIREVEELFKLRGYTVVRR